MLLVEELFSLPDTHKDAIDSTNESPLNAKAIGGAKLVNVPIAPLKVDKIFNQSLPDISPSVTPIIVKGRLAANAKPPRASLHFLKKLHYD